VDIGRRPILNAADWALKRDPVPKAAEKNRNLRTSRRRLRSLEASEFAGFPRR
jgi:hypothetical protein